MGTMVPPAAHRGLEQLLVRRGAPDTQRLLSAPPALPRSHAPSPRAPRFPASTFAEHVLPTWLRASGTMEAVCPCDAPGGDHSVVQGNPGSRHRGAEQQGLEVWVQT